MYLNITYKKCNFHYYNNCPPMVLSKGGKPITQNGLIINDSNLTMLLTTRHESKKARMAGAHLKGPKKRTNENDKAFIDSLNKLLND